MESLVLQMGKDSFHVSITTGQAILRLVSAKNTLHIGNYHCPADLLFDWFGSDKLVNMLLIQQKQSSLIQTLFVSPKVRYWSLTDLSGSINVQLTS